MTWKDDALALSIDDARICVLGLGYVGLPLAVAFGQKFDTVGYDLDSGRIEELKRGHDRTLELDLEELQAARRLILTDDPS
jgi:UDP-N-acetyl-D-galactosamine dehydrogenase